MRRKYLLKRILSFKLDSTYQLTRVMLEIHQQKKLFVRYYSPET